MRPYLTSALGDFSVLIVRDLLNGTTGTAVYIQGIANDDLVSLYSVTLDGRTMSFPAPVPPGTQHGTCITFYAVSGLSNTLHTVTITNGGHPDPVSYTNPVANLYIDSFV